MVVVAKKTTFFYALLFLKVLENVKQTHRSVIIQVRGITFFKTGTTFAKLKLMKNFPLLKNWLKYGPGPLKSIHVAHAKV